MVLGFALASLRLEYLGWISTFFEYFCAVVLENMSNILITLIHNGSSVSIVTGYGLYGPGIESRWGRDFSAPVQTGPGAHPASCTMGTVSFLGVKSGRGVTLTPHPLLVPLVMKE